MNNLNYGLWLKYSILIVSVLVLLGVVIYVQRDSSPADSTEVSMADEAVGGDDQTDDDSSSSKEEQTEEAPKTLARVVPELSSNRVAVSPVVTQPETPAQSTEELKRSQDATAQPEKEPIKSEDEEDDKSSNTPDNQAPATNPGETPETAKNATTGHPQNIVAYFTAQKKAQQKIANAPRAPQNPVPIYLAQNNTVPRAQGMVPQPVYNTPNNVAPDPQRFAPQPYNTQNNVRPVYVDSPRQQFYGSQPVYVAPSAPVQYSDYPLSSGCDVCADNCCQNCCQDCCQDCCSNCPGWTSARRLTISHTEGRWLDNHDGYTTFALFSKICGDGYCRPMFFADLRGHVFNNGKYASNIGGGVRYQFCNSIFGINAYYDNREACWNHNYNQWGLGLEMLNPCFDVRINMYFPVGSHDGHGKRHVFDDFVGDYRADCREHRKSVGGADFEVGRWLCSGPCDCVNFYAAVGAYYFDRHEHDETAFGGQARLVSHVGRYLTFEVRGGYDPVYHGNIQGTVGISIPLDCLCNMFRRDCCGNSNAGCCDDCCLIYQPVVRNQILALDKKKCCWHWNWPSNGCKCSSR